MKQWSAVCINKRTVEISIKNSFDVDEKCWIYSAPFREACFLCQSASSPYACELCLWMPGLHHRGFLGRSL